MAQFIRNVLADVPVKVLEDGTGTAIGGNSGNLICLPASFRADRPALALFAHMDTPRSTEGVRPVVSADRITSDGSTILGVDNRAGTAALLHTLCEHARSGGGGNFIVVFTVGEELGLFGSKHFDPTPYDLRMGFVFDCSKRPGTFIQSAVGCSLYTATFAGLASHAAVSPEKGIHAIRMAARALLTFPTGRLEGEMTANVGTIKGGEATNIIPDLCTLQGEIRGFDPGRINEMVLSVQAQCEHAASEAGGRVTFSTAEDFRPFVLEDKAPAFALTEEVLRSCGLTPHPISYTGGSDANMLNAAGLPTVNLGIGAQNPHGNDEFILLEDLEQTAQIARRLIQKSGEI
jgi:tripeptide aminopeptidase